MMAYRQVAQNKGSGGIDGMPVNELYAWLTQNREQWESEVRSNKYLSQPILGVEIPKSNGESNYWAFRWSLTECCNKQSVKS